MIWYNCNYRGGGISNSQIITEEGKYSLDAVQNNPDIKGSLRQELDSISAKAGSQIVNAWNDFDLDTSDGYIHLIRIKILSSHMDIPLRFTVNGRMFDKPVSLVVRFATTADTDPGVARYVTDGSHKFYIVKETPGVWDIYAQHIPYKTVFVTQAEYCRYVRKELIDVTYPNNLVNSLPGGSLEFTSMT